MLYDPSLSERGAIIPAGRAPRAASVLDFQPPLLIKAPHTLPLFREEGDKRGGGRKRGGPPTQQARGGEGGREGGGATAGSRGGAPWCALPCRSA